jgi:hypothetical protein
MAVDDRTPKDVGLSRSGISRAAHFQQHDLRY